MSKNNTVYIGKNKGFWDRNRRSEGYLLKRRSGQIAYSVIRALLLFGLCFMIIQPLLTRFSLSLMSQEDLNDTTIILLPRHPSVESYKTVATVNYVPESLINSLWVSFVVSLCQILSTTLVAYGFARYEFRFKKFWFACVVAVIIIPPQTIQTALYMNVMNFDVLRIFTLFGVNAEGLSFGQRLMSVIDGTGTGLIRLITGKAYNLRENIGAYIMMGLTCMGLKNGLYIYMMREYFKGIPTSLEEAAYVDGCGTLHTFARIMLPDAFPTIASCFLFSFVWQWTDVFYSRIFLSNNFHFYSKEITGMLARLSTDATGRTTTTLPAGRRQQLVTVAVLICAVPLIILYIFTQRTFVESLAMSGSKE